MPRAVSVLESRRSMTNTSVVVLVSFLWIAGGFGWIVAREARGDQPLGWLTCVLILLVWPLMAVWAAGREIWSAVRGDRENGIGS